MTLRMNKGHLNRIREHGEETYPHESCGVLVGQSVGMEIRTVLDVVRCKNTRNDFPQNRYNIDPSDLILIQSESRLAGREILGFYHSHPDHPAQWSVTDLAEAHWTGCSYVITSIEKGAAMMTNSFLLLGGEEAKSFQIEEIVVID